jgi:hypothetical protein
MIIIYASSCGGPKPPNGERQPVNGRALDGHGMSRFAVRCLDFHNLLILRLDLVSPVGIEPTTY